jgi:predicted nucleic acid-binding protein
MSSCERLAPRYERDLGVAQAELRPPGQGVVRRSNPSEYVPEQGHDCRNQVWHRAVANCRSITRQRLEAWLKNELRPWFAERLLDVDEDVFVVWRRLVERGKAMRHTFPQPDLFIAATAILHDLCVATRNAGDFISTGVSVLNPWTDTQPRLAE